MNIRFVDRPKSLEIRHKQKRTDLYDAIAKTLDTGQAVSISRSEMTATAKTLLLRLRQKALPRNAPQDSGSRRGKRLVAGIPRRYCAFTLGAK